MFGQTTTCVNHSHLPPPSRIKHSNAIAQNICSNIYIIPTSKTYLIHMNCFWTNELSNWLSLSLYELYDRTLISHNRTFEDVWVCVRSYWFLIVCNNLCLYCCGQSDRDDQDSSFIHHIVVKLVLKVFLIRCKASL